MASSSSYPKKVRVVLTNDDGPPSAAESPNIFSFAQALRKQLDWDVRVVVPSSQKSWIGKAYQIKDVINGNYLYPTEPHGEGEICATQRDLKEGEVAEWILLDGTPATCTNISLFNLFPDGVDLVISGPNHGRNSSSAFSLSSGTIGAALSSSIAKVRSIALSYGVMREFGPVQPKSRELANDLSVKLIERIWADWGRDELGWGSREGEVDLYTINVPLVEEYLSNPKFYFTRVWRNNYTSLFKPIPPPEGADEASSKTLSFRFQPDMQALVQPPLDSLPIGTDAWAVHSGYISITPLRASFAEPGEGSFELASGAGRGEAKGVGREWLLEGHGGEKNGRL